MNEPHAVVSHDEWLEARRRFLAREKAFTRERDQLTAERRALPWERVDKAYVFDTPQGKQTLAELFGACSQLVVYHFMFGPDWQEPCMSCSFWADNFNSIPVHLRHRDVTLIAVTSAPLAKIDALKQRLGWTFTMVSSGGNSFVAIVELGERVSARALSIGGESGDPGSPHFGDQASRYAGGSLRKVYFYPEELEGHVEREYHPR